jgi:drug/metabolite transporter superfamily protein YnfA
MIFFPPLFVLAGLLMIVGAHFRWSWLVDPPSDWWPYYSQAFIKKFLGRKGVLIYTYGLGILFLVMGVVWCL